MKLRLKNDTLRLRVSPSEVVRLVEQGQVESETAGEGPEKRLVYRLELNDAVTGPSVVWEPMRIAVRLPVDKGRAWAAGNQVGVEAVQQFVDGRRLTITVEKDFECLHSESDEADEEGFPHPARAEAGA